MHRRRHNQTLILLYLIAAIVCVGVLGNRADASEETETEMRDFGTANTVEVKTLYLTSLSHMGRVELDIYDAKSNTFQDVYYLGSDLAQDLQAIAEEPLYMEKGYPEEEGDIAYQVKVYDGSQSTLFTWIKYENGQIYNDRNYMITGDLLSQWLKEVEEEYCIYLDSDDENEDSNDNNENVYNNEDDNDEYVLTAGERVFLRKLGMDIEDDDNEEAVTILTEYRNALDYLHEKYPSYSFTITDCMPDVDEFSSYSTFFFTDNDGYGTYELQYARSKDADAGEDDYECMDNFYSSFVSDDYSEILMDLIKIKIPECIGVYTTMSTVHGMDYGEDLDAQKIIDGDMSVSTFSRIFLEGSYEEDAPLLLQETEEYIESLGVNGSYIVYVMADMSENYGTGKDMMNYVNANGDDAYFEMEAFQVTS